MNTYCGVDNVKGETLVKSEVKVVVGGTKNYSDLENKPQINGVELTGNKTNEDLNIRPLTNQEIESIMAKFE